VMKFGNNSTIDYYNRNHSKYRTRTKDQDLSELYAPFLKLLPPHGRILDAGCGVGRDLKHFGDLGYQVEGIDASIELLKHARLISDAPCNLLAFEDVHWVGEFDGVWACASLLHLSKNIIRDAVGGLTRALKKDGVLYASLQKGEGEHQLSDGRFFAKYGTAELEKIISETDGLELINIWKTIDSSGTRPNIVWINFLAKRVEGFSGR
jgi:SAM-dependent methyltransferase